jgi:hypothetical protein
VAQFYTNNFLIFERINIHKVQKKRIIESLTGILFQTDQVISRLGFSRFLIKNEG